MYQDKKTSSELGRTMRKHCRQEGFKKKTKKTVMLEWQKHHEVSVAGRPVESNFFNVCHFHSSCLELVP